jgi:hypothetical protein
MHDTGVEENHLVRRRSSITEKVDRIPLTPDGNKYIPQRRGSNVAGNISSLKRDEMELPPALTRRESSQESLLNYENYFEESKDQVRDGGIMGEEEWDFLGDGSVKTPHFPDFLGALPQAAKCYSTDFVCRYYTEAERLEIRPLAKLDRFNLNQLKLNFQGA